LWWQSLVAREQINGLFGTKFIADVLMAFCGYGEAGGPTLTGLLGEKVIRLRRDLIDVSVSDLIAHRTNTWHLWRRQDGASYGAALDEVEVEDRTLLARYAHFRQIEETLDARLGEQDVPTLVMPFGRLVENVDRCVAEIAGFLGAAPRPVQPEWRAPESWRTHSAVHRHLAERLRGLVSAKAA
jgi:hypothetical protein